MKKSILCSATAIMVIVIMFSSCKKTDSSNTPVSPPPFSAFVNSISFTSVAYSDTLFKRTVTRVVHVGNLWDTTVTGAKTLRISATDTQGNNLIFYISDWRDSTIGNGMRLGTYNFNQSAWITNSNNSAAVSAYATYNGINYLDNNSTATGGVTITACDTIAHTVSGTFSGLIPPYSGSGSSLVLGSGTFNKLSYMIVSE